MLDWTCRVCGNMVQGRALPPAYCPKCSVGTFARTADPPHHPIQSDPAAPATPSLSPVGPSRPLANPEPRPLASAPEAPGVRKGSRPAKRIQPKEPLEVRIARTTSLLALNISATGLLVEYARPFPPGSICDVEVWRSSLGIRLRAKVVRSCVSGGGKGSQTGLCYRTAVHFLETPPAIFTLLPELSEEP
jgi:hypothetical protein